jgi:hypothetical protein
MPVIPATEETEIRRIMVPDQSWLKKFVTPYLNRKKLSAVAHACHPSISGKHKIGK